MYRLHLILSGRVQGVFFRAETRAKARQLGLVGWVKNLPDGSVEAVAEGPKEPLNQFLVWCRRGPAMAHVTKVTSLWEEATGSFEVFLIQ